MITYSGINTLENLGNAKNYNKWILEQFLPYIDEPLLEIGSGTGNIAQYLSKDKKIYLSDNDEGLVAYLREKFRKEKNVIVFQHDITKSSEAKYKDFFASVIGINVLEHIEDDTKALENIYTILRKNGKILLLVPAKKFAYTKFDKKIGHFRRYEKKELIDKLEKSGFVVEKMYPFNIVGLIAWYALDKVHWRSHELKSTHISIFEWLVPILRIIESLVSIPIGISFIVVARKN